ncbi:MAG: UPF0182 family protein [Polaromonas sp.]|nr:UPF0182 family protein [Gemmatimonadaceae bacterium]
MTGRRVLGGALAITALVLVVGRWTAGLYTEYHWYASLGALDVWRARMSTMLALGTVSFAAAALFAFINFFAVRRSVVSLVLPRRLANIEIGEQVPGHLLLGAVVLLSVMVGALLVAPLDGWHEALLAFVGKPFSEVDPYFGADLGFFVYWLPFETAIHLWAVIVLTSVTGLVVLLYALTPSLRWERGTLFVSAYVRRHFIMLGAVLLLVLAWSYRLGMYRELAFGGGAAGVFTSTDHRLIPVMLLLSVYTVCAALVVGWAGWTGQIRLAFAAVTTVLLFSLGSRTIAPLVMRRSIDPASNRVRESPYIATRLNFTRRAYGVDRMRAELLGAGFATADEAASRLAIWDGATLARAVERLPRVRAMGVRAAWQANAGTLSAMLVERVSDAAGGSHDAWSLARYEASRADERGSPRRVADGAPGGDVLLASEPAAFDSAPSYTVMSDSLRQLAGVELVSTRSRFMYAWSLQNFRLLFGDLPANQPVIVQRRAIRERLHALAPFFEQGSEIVPVVTGDTLYWAVELYATSASYPLSQRFTVLGEERSYMQHAATALVHAASGRVLFIVTTSPDPVTLSWMARFPGLLKAAASLSPALRAQLPPVTDGARTQALAFAAAGFRGDSLEVKHFATPDGADSSASAHEPTYALLPTLGGVASLWPLLDSTERVRGMVAAIGGSARVTAWLPVASDGRRWGAVVDLLRIADSAQSVAGVVRSPLRVAPLLDRALYVQPIYQWRAGTTPVLSRVAASVHDTARVGNSLAAALGTAAAVRTSGASAPPALRPRADSLYRVMRDALGRGDWAAFGRAFDALGIALREATP